VAGSATTWERNARDRIPHEDSSGQLGWREVGLRPTAIMNRTGFVGGPIP